MWPGTTPGSTRDRFGITGFQVAAGALWTGALAVPLGTLAAGAVMRAHFALFFEMEGGLIRVQRNYDCFEPW